MKEDADLLLRGLYKVSLVDDDDDAWCAWTRCDGVLDGASGAAAASSAGNVDEELTPEDQMWDMLATAWGDSD